MTDQERQKHPYQGPGVNKNLNISQADILSKPKRRKKGTRVIEGAIATTIALLAPLQAGTVYEKISSTDKNTGIMASAGIHYSSIARQVAHEPASPPLTTTTTSKRVEVRPVAKPKPVEKPRCIDGWELLNEGVCRTKLREYGSDINVVRADLKNPNVSVNPSYVEGPGRLGRLSDGAEKQGAVAAINGSFFIGTRALGPIAANGEWLQKDTFPQQVLIVNNDKITAKILPTHEALTENPAQMMLALPGSHVLVQNGIAKVDFGPDNAGSMLNGRHRRTAAGWTENGEAFLVTAGGMTIPEFASVMYKIGVHTAINLDGGSSSGMVTEVDGQVSKGPSQPIAIFLGVYARN